MTKEELRIRTIINLQELINELKKNDVASYFGKNSTINSTRLSSFNRLRIQTTKDLCQLENYYKG